MGNLRRVVAVQDESSHWYVIPVEMESEFHEDNENVDLVDSGDFDDKWGKYSTGGCLNLKELWANI